MNKVYPKCGTIYTYKEIVEILTLRDSPSLNFSHKNMLGVIQESHLTQEQLLSVPGMIDTTWRYVRETLEWIPLFDYSGDINKLLEVIDIEPASEFYQSNQPITCWWATPKGFPRNQHE